MEIMLPWEAKNGAYPSTDPQYCKLCKDVFYETLEDHIKQEHLDLENDNETI
jgi:hypothetical protein